MERKVKKEEVVMSEAPTSPLRNEKIFVRFVPHDIGMSLKKQRFRRRPSNFVNNR